MLTALDFNFVLRLIINIISIVTLVRGCYYRKSGDRNFSTSFILFGINVFLITYLLHAVKISMGFAFGLFAIFSMLRYRTESISIKEMTYLFLVITIALLAAVGPVSIFELIILNGCICLAAHISEVTLFLPQLSQKKIQYERIENIKPENNAALIADLKARTGLDIQKVDILLIDFLHDSASLNVHYKPATSSKELL